MTTSQHDQQTNAGQLLSNSANINIPQQASTNIDQKLNDAQQTSNSNNTTTDQKLNDINDQQSNSNFIDITPQTTLTMQYQYKPSVSNGLYGSYNYYTKSECNTEFKQDGVLISCHFILNNKFNLYISFGSVINSTTDVIVNAADEYMLGGDGVDGAITAAGGPQLDEYRRAVPFVNNDILNGVRCPTGDARITKTAGSLKCKHFVIHSVGPDYSKMLKFKKKHETKKDIFLKGDKLLYKCYENTMKLAQQYNCKSIAFSLISAGIFKGQQDIKLIFEITAKAIKNNLYIGLQHLYMVAFTGHELNMLQKIMPIIWGQPQNVYFVNPTR